MKILLNKKWEWLVVLLIGSLLPFAFAPYHYYALSFIIPAILFGFCYKASPKKAFFYGLLFGLGFFGVGVSWVYVSIHIYGHASPLIAVIITGLFVAALSLFIACQFFIANSISRYTSTLLTLLLIYPISWVIFEILRGIIASGFPWLYLGYSQTSSILRGFAPIIGVYGLSLMVAGIAGALVSIVLIPSKRYRIICTLIIAGLFSTGFYLSDRSWTISTSKPITVSLIQGNVQQMLKWDPAHLVQILNDYETLTKQHWKSQIIVWPEAAIPTYPETVPDYLNQLDQAAKQHKTTVIIGIPTDDPNTESAYNSLMALGKGHGVYRKRHLVPFGEYTPMLNLIRYLKRYVDIPMSGFTKGESQQPSITANGISIAPFICYEIGYPYLALKTIQNTGIIVVISDDSWFGNSSASAQQLQMAQMRALETGRYVLYSTNTGITAIINPQGKIQSQLPINQQAVLTDTVNIMQGNTPLGIFTK